VNETPKTAVVGAVLPDGAPDQRPETDKPDGQHAGYTVLSDEERAKGFVRPVRHSYEHVGLRGPTFPTRPLTPEEHANIGDTFAVFEPYPEGARGLAAGRYWTPAELAKVGKGCGTVTTMGRGLAETYAREPGFYGATFCCGCGTHIKVGEFGEFVWEGTDVRVGT
jgi:hypothetical protein